MVTNKGVFDYLFCDSVPQNVGAANKTNFISDLAPEILRKYSFNVGIF